MPSQKKTTIKRHQHHLIKDIDFTGKANKGSSIETRIGIASNNHLTHGSLCLEIKEIIKKYDLYPLKF